MRGFCANSLQRFEIDANGRHAIDYSHWIHFGPIFPLLFDFLSSNDSQMRFKSVPSFGARNRCCEKYSPVAPLVLVAPLSSKQSQFAPAKAGVVVSSQEQMAKTLCTRPSNYEQA